MIYLMMGSADWHGDETLDPAWCIPSEFTPGTFADFAVVPKGNAIPLPGRLSPLHASVPGTAWLTAYRALFTKSRLRAAQTRLCNLAELLKVLLTIADYLYIHLI